MILIGTYSKKTKKKQKNKAKQNKTKQTKPLYRINKHLKLTAYSLST
jgi:hypothetical protein